MRQATDLFRPVHEATNPVDGWVSLEVSPTLAYDTNALAADLQREGAAAFVTSWEDLLVCIAEKSAMLKNAS